MAGYYLDWRGVRLRIRAGETVIGRGVGCELHIDDPTASRRHAALRSGGGSVTVRDLGSRNGTFVNGDRVDGECEVVAGDRVLVGESLFTVGVGESVEAGERAVLSLPTAVSDGLALVEQGARRNLQEVTEPHVGSLEVIESLLDSPHAADEPDALASMVQSSVDRLLANLERREASLPASDQARLLALVDRVRGWFPDGTLDGWWHDVRRRLEP